MSARTPFVPGQPFVSSSRPESRSAHPSTPASGTTSTPLHFVADPSNPLNGGPVPQKDRVDNSDNRPLNIGSLTKSNRSQNAASSRRPSLQSTNHVSRPATSDPISLHAPIHPTRPGTSDPHSKSKSNVAPNHRLQAHANSHSIVAPTPLQARSTPSMFSNSASSFSASFKTPAMPAARASPQQQPSTDAHDSHPTDQTDTPHKSREELVPDNSAFRLKTLPSQPGPHRLVFSARQAVTDLTEEDEIYEIPEPDGAKLRNGNGRNKRGRSEVDDEEDGEDGYGVQTKRFKVHQQQHVERQNDENSYPDANEIYHHSSSPQHEVHRYSPQQPPRHHHSAGARSGNATFGQRFPAQYSNSLQQSPEISNPQHSSDIARLIEHFKADGIDLACDARIEKHNRLSEKWKMCTNEEWLAGADELTGVYAKIFDFVKSHMIAKVQLFAACDGRLQKQTEVLKEREDLLVGVRDRMVAEGGSVLGT
ncbi:hypothetical protein B0H11DRAFT_55096 [Mycena galericulata]|nr:hypothetical protein B0H11DRAFT_55096 [Mycena galericulata]